jgi:UDP-N-acetylmuramoyl-L-alanyl-D-glutamate--2,6-diaminopimelate ligase
MNMAAERVTQSHDLRQLLQGMADAPAIELHGISDDSRTVRKGDAFFALQGDRSHGLDYLEKVLEAGAAAVIWDPQTRVLDKTVDATALIPLEELGGHLGEIANRWYGAPSKALQVSAVTGTNGKTTVAWLLAACMRELGQKCGYVGTLGAGLEEPEETGGLTTPTCLQLHSLFSAFRNGGASAATLEVSSHALQQDRIAGVHLDSAIFTNLSRDHIDYHGDMQNYGETKARLFLDHDLQHRIYPNPLTAVLPQHMGRRRIRAQNAGTLQRGQCQSCACAAAQLGSIAFRRLRCARQGKRAAGAHAARAGSRGTDRVCRFCPHS